MKDFEYQNAIDSLQDDLIAEVNRCQRRINKHNQLCKRAYNYSSHELYEKEGKSEWKLVKKAERDLELAKNKQRILVALAKSTSAREWCLAHLP